MKTKMILAVGVLLCAAFASAQEGGQGGRQGRRGMQFGQMGRGIGNELQLAFRADVQVDLAVTPDQKTKLTELQNKQRQGNRAGAGAGAAGGGVRGGNRGQMTDAEREAMRKQQEERQAQMRKDLSSILSETQMKRLSEIRIQLQGSRAVMQADTQKELGLSAAQIATIEDLQQKQQAANRALQEKVRNNEMTREDVQKSIQNNTKILDAELAKVLTPEQSAKLKAMGGKAFKADPPQGRGGG